MTEKNILDIRNRADFRQWLKENHSTEKECWISVKRGKTPPENVLWYLDAVEEALCFGWIDSTLKNIDGISLQRFGRRSKNSYWSELNKERSRRLIKLGQMTDCRLATCPNLDAEFIIIPDIIEAFKANPVAWDNFNKFPRLYQRVRIDNIQRNKTYPQIIYGQAEKTHRSK